MARFNDKSQSIELFDSLEWLERPQEIYTYSWPAQIEPLVSICCITYQHEHFISDAIEGFLKQKTTFKVEILIHDDASEDRTPDILKKYELLYPGLIKVIYQEKNQYSRGNNPEQSLFDIAKGSYIALCEGDDYWTDPLKLQKQVEFLEDHPDFSACFGGYSRLTQNNGKVQKEVKSGNSPDYSNGFEFTLHDMQQRWLTKTLTAVFRTDILARVDLSGYNYYRDIHLFYHLIKNNKAFYFQDILGVYRIHKGGTNSMNQGKVNKNVAYHCYRELYLCNDDEFTRVMCLKTTLGLLNFYLFNRHQRSKLSDNLRLVTEALFLIRSINDIKMFFALFLKRELKDKIKKLFSF